MTFVGGRAVQDSSLQGPADPFRINVHSAAELRHLVREIGRPAMQIKLAVNAVGPLVDDVRTFLRQRGVYAGLR